MSEVGTDWYGDWVYIDHDNGWQTRYLHINKLASMVIGKTVVRGQKIGSGCSVTATPGLPPGGSVTCTEGAGVRVVVECLNMAKNIEYVSQGPWVGAGAASIAKCASTHAVTDRSFAISPP